MTIRVRIKYYRSKMEYITFCFTLGKPSRSGVRLGDTKLQSNEYFKHLRSIFQKNEDINQNVAHKFFVDGSNGDIH